jgi:hypothetical protein
VTNRLSFRVSGFATPGFAVIGRGGMSAPNRRLIGAKVKHVRTVDRGSQTRLDISTQGVGRTIPPFPPGPSDSQEHKRLSSPNFDPLLLIEIISLDHRHSLPARIIYWCHRSESGGWPSHRNDLLGKADEPRS